MNQKTKITGNSRTFRQYCNKKKLSESTGQQLRRKKKHKHASLHVRNAIRKKHTTWHLSIITSHHNHTQYIYLINILVHHYALSEGKSTAIISLVERQFPQKQNPGCPLLPNMGKRGTFHPRIRTTNGLVFAQQTVCRENGI